MSFVENRALKWIFGSKRNEKTTYEGALCSAHLTKYYSGDQINKTEMG
jgi:hypothetical protein